jgi:hypothetical protein
MDSSGRRKEIPDSVKSRKEKFFKHPQEAALCRLLTYMVWYDKVV